MVVKKKKQARSKENKSSSKTKTPLKPKKREVKKGSSTNKQKSPLKSKKPLKTEKNKKKTYRGEEHFLASIEPYKIKKNEKYMNAGQKKHFSTILNSWKNQLLLEQGKTASHLQQSTSNFPDEADRASHEEEFTLELRTRERERKLLSKIDSSLESVKENFYGHCNLCGIEIGVRRLEARPTATRCIDCKTLEEIHERQRYG